MSSAVARASSRSDVLSLYRRFLRLAEPYVESPGVKRFLQDQLMAEARGQSLSAADLAEYKMQLTDNHALAAYVRDFVGEHFRRNKVVSMFFLCIFHFGCF